MICRECQRPFDHRASSHPGPECDPCCEDKPRDSLGIKKVIRWYSQSKMIDSVGFHKPGFSWFSFTGDPRDCNAYVLASDFDSEVAAHNITANELVRTESQVKKLKDDRDKVVDRRIKYWMKAAERAFAELAAALEGSSK